MVEATHWMPLPEADVITACVGGSRDSAHVLWWRHGWTGGLDGPMGRYSGRQMQLRLLLWCPHLPVCCRGTLAASPPSDCAQFFCTSIFLVHPHLLCSFFLLIYPNLFVSFSFCCFSLGFILSCLPLCQHTFIAFTICTRGENLGFCEIQKGLLALAFSYWNDLG